MTHFMEETHVNKKTQKINNMKTKQILDGAKSKLELSYSQSQTEGDDSVQPNAYTEEDINNVMLQVSQIML